MEATVAVIGTTFIDCKGFARQKYNRYGRNLGNIQFVHGGVGRNVAENLAMLNLPTFFVSSVDNSALGSEVADRLSNFGVRLNFLSYAEKNGMGMWLAILDQGGELAGSISQMPDLCILEGIIEKWGGSIMETASHIALELDLNESLSRRVVELARQSGRKVYGIPGNLDIILKNRDLLTYTDCFICNDIEAGRLFETSFSDMETGDLLAGLVKFASGEGIPSMVITLGPRGAVYYDFRTARGGYQPAFSARLVDSSGAGDAFFSGTVMGLAKGRPLSESVVYGTKVAYWTIQAEENTCLDLPAKIREDELFRQIVSPVKDGLNRATG